MADEKAEKALALLTYGVNVVTVGQGGVENGLTVSWLSQVSFEPPMVMIALEKSHYSVEFLDSTKNFVVNILGEAQKEIAAHFAKTSLVGSEKTAGLDLDEAPSGAPIIKDSLAFLDCEVVDKLTFGSHIVFIGEVKSGDKLNDGKPMTSQLGFHYRPGK